MDPAFVHVEVLGPRSSLDRWLSVLQDHGGCHLADSLRGLEGQPGVGRPSPEGDALREEVLRSEALGVLSGLERILPAAAAAGEVPPQPEALREEALALAARVRTALEAARAAEADLRRHDALEAAVAACSAGGSTTVVGRVWSLPRGEPGAPSLARALRRAGVPRIQAARGDLEAIVVALPEPHAGPGGATVGHPTAAEAEAAGALGARLVELPPDVAGRPVDEVRRRLEVQRFDLLRRDREAAQQLEARVRQDGPRGRRLLDHLEDAEERARARRTLAAFEHVAAARAFVRREDVGDLRGRLRRAFGDDVVVRSLSEADDTPDLPRETPATPLGALEALRWARVGTTPGPAVLAVWAPLVVAAAWADLGGGLLLLALGGLAGRGASSSSARRDVAFLAQAAGLVALVLGILSGRAFGAAGARWFGSDWGLRGAETSFRPTGDPLRDVLVGLGAVAFVLAIWSALAAVRHAGRGLPARARQAVVAALSHAVLAGASGVALGADVLAFGWVLSAAAFAALVVVAGRGGLVRGLLDLAAELRLVAVGGGALLLVRWAFDAWAHPSARTLLAGAGALLVGALAFVVDAAHMAMSPAYEASLGGRAVAPPFRPFARRAGGTR